MTREQTLARDGLHAILLVVVLLAYDRCPPAEASTVYPECLNRDLVVDLEQAGAEPWELRAAQAIALRRTPVDITETGACGWAHLTPCPWPTRWGALAALYSDDGPSVVLETWRRRIGPAVRQAIRHGWPAYWAAGLANSTGSAGLLRLAEACEWDRACTAREYATTPHRRRRLRDLEAL